MHLASRALDTRKSQWHESEKYSDCESYLVATSALRTISYTGKSSNLATSRSSGTISGTLLLFMRVRRQEYLIIYRIYESGHEVPFYQPLLALEMFQRAICGLDIADGMESVWHGYKSVGTADTTYREGNATIQTTLVPDTATYNTTTNMPNPFNATNSTSAKRSLGERKMRSKRLFKPVASKVGKEMTFA